MTNKDHDAGCRSPSDSVSHPRYHVHVPPPEYNLGAHRWANLMVGGSSNSSNGGQADPNGGDSNVHPDQAASKVAEYSVRPR